MRRSSSRGGSTMTMIRNEVVRTFLVMITDGT